MDTILRDRSSLLLYQWYSYVIWYENVILQILIYQNLLTNLFNFKRFKTCKLNFNKNKSKKQKATEIPLKGEQM